MHWAKQPCDCLIADVEKQGKQQKHATIAMETAHHSGSPVLHYFKHNLRYEFDDSFISLT